MLNVKSGNVFSKVTIFYHNVFTTPHFLWYSSIFNNKLLIIKLDNNGPYWKLRITTHS